MRKRVEDMWKELEIKGVQKLLVGVEALQLRRECYK